MAKQIIWSKLAQIDRFEILDYWKKRNKSSVYSKKLNSLFENTAELISRHPNIGKPTQIQNVKLRIINITCLHIV
jgi:toxin YoeB